MKKKYFSDKQLFIYILFTLLFLNKTKAQVAHQSFNWANSITPTSQGLNDSQGNSITRDNNNHVITIGSFFGANDFDPNPTSQKISNGNNTGNLYVQKLKPNGDYLWHKSYGNQFSTRGIAVTIDNNNDIYILGDFSGTLTFNASTSITSNGNKDAFVLKLASDGTVLWARNFGLSRYDNGSSIFYNKNTNELYFTGNYQTIITPPFVSSNGFLYKLNANGSDVWFKTFSGLTTSGLTGDDSGHVYMTGTHRKGLDELAYPSNNVISNLLNREPWDRGFSAYILKINNLGAVIWAKGTGRSDDEDFIRIKAITVDNNNLFMVGRLKGHIYFTPNSAIDTRSSTTGFGSSFSKNGTFRWVKEIPFSSGGANTIALDNQGGLIIGGSGGIGRYSSSNGDFDWIHGYNSSNGNIGRVNSLVVNECNEICATGYIEPRPNDFNPNPTINHQINVVGQKNAFNFSWKNATTNFNTSFTYIVCTNTLKVTGTWQPFGTNPNSDWHLIKYYDPNIPNMTPVTVSSIYWWQQPTPYSYNTNTLTFNYQLVPGCLYYVKHAMYLNNNCAPWQEAREYGIQSNLISCRLAEESQSFTKSKKDTNPSQSKDYNLRIFPNPVAEFLDIKSTSSKVISYKIFDILGKNIANSKYNNEPIDVSIFQSGSYIIQITTSEGVYAKQFIKK